MISAAETVPWRIDAARRRTSSQLSSINRVLTRSVMVERTEVRLRPADGEEPLVNYVADPWCKAEAHGRAQSEYMRGVPSSICEVLVNVQVGLVVAQPIDDLQRFAVVGADDLGWKGRRKSAVWP